MHDSLHFILMFIEIFYDSIISLITFIVVFVLFVNFILKGFFIIIIEFLFY